MVNITYISLGVQCFGSMALQKMGLNNKFYPFDNMLSNIIAVKFLIETIYLNGYEEAYKKFYNNIVCGEWNPGENMLINDLKEIKNSFVNSKLNISFVHDDYNDKNTTNKYLRRFMRLEESLLRNDEIVFIYTDPRNDEEHHKINSKPITPSPLPLIIEFCEMMLKYKQNFKFLYFTFNEHENTHNKLEFRKISQYHYSIGDSIRINEIINHLKVT